MVSQTEKEFVNKKKSIHFALLVHRQDYRNELIHTVLLTMLYSAKYIEFFIYQFFLSLGNHLVIPFFVISTCFT
jgi:hypothetical protein